MRKFRGVIALCVSLCLAFLASYAVYSYMEQPKEKPVRQAKAPVKKAPPPPRPEPGLTGAIPPGMRAITLRIDKLEGVPLELCSGDLVDVIAAGPISTLYDNMRLSGMWVSRVVFEAVKVMKADLYKKPSKMRPVTLIVTPEQGSNLLAVANTPGTKIRLVIRNPEDTAPVGVPPKTFSSASGEAELDTDIPDLDIDSLVPPGMRVVSLRTGYKDGLQGKFKAGDYVDIVVTCPFSMTRNSQTDKARILTSTHQNSKIWRQNVKILAAGDDFRKRIKKSGLITDETEEEENTDSKDKDEDESQAGESGSVLVALPPEDAEAIIAMGQIASASRTRCDIIRLLARHPDDHEKVATEGVRLEAIFGGKKLYKEVDQFRGVKRKTQLFFEQEKQPEMTER